MKNKVSSKYTKAKGWLAEGEKGDVSRKLNGEQRFFMLYDNERGR